MAGLGFNHNSLIPNKEFTQMPLAQHLSEYIRAAFTGLWVEPDYLDDEQRIAWVRDQWERTLAGELKLLGLEMG